MTTALQPIPTKHSGVLFRSRLEARWAVFFDHLGIAWEYEPEAYRLLDGRGYLPDFRLPTFSGGVFAEVKPRGDDFDKAIEFARSGGQVWLCDGEPALRVYRLLRGGDGEVESLNVVPLYGRAGYEDRFWYEPGQDEINPADAPRIVAAAALSRAHRFWEPRP